MTTTNSVVVAAIITITMFALTTMVGCGGGETGGPAPSYLEDGGWSVEIRDFTSAMKISRDEATGVVYVPRGQKITVVAIAITDKAKSLDEESPTKYASVLCKGDTLRPEAGGYLLTEHGKYLASVEVGGVFRPFQSIVVE